jgi:hypothetical protein
LSILHCVSISTGKDSAATAILAQEEHPPEALRFGACDTGNEDDGFEDYLAYMERHLGIKIARLRADLSAEVIRFREYVREHWPRKGVPQADCERAIKALVPTGNPFLDLCLWKGRFPSRRAQFCTDFLKTRPLTEWQMGFIDRGECEAVWSWQGVRLDESEARRTRLQGTGACVRSFDVVGGGSSTIGPSCAGRPPIASRPAASRRSPRHARAPTGCANDLSPSPQPAPAQRSAPAAAPPRRSRARCGRHPAHARR